MVVVRVLSDVRRMRAIVCVLRSCESNASGEPAASRESSITGVGVWS